MAGFLKRIARAAFGSEQRSSLENPQVPLNFPAEWLLDMFNGGRTDSGVRVSEMTALQVGTVYACVNIVSNGFAALPLHVCEVVKTKASHYGQRRAYDHNLYDVLNKEPNPEMTAFTWLKTMMVHCLLWANAYSEIERDNANQIVALWPRNPARTRAIRTTRTIVKEGTTYPAGTLMFETSETMMTNNYGGSDTSEDKSGTRRLVLAEDMIHVPGLSIDGRVGQNTVWLARQILGLALATEKYGAKFFSNGARPAGILKIPNAMQQGAIENLRRSWSEAHGGENQFKVAVLEQGVEFTKIAATPEEGQMLQTRSYQREEICNVFNVPFHMIAMGKGMGKSNVEQSSIEFVLYCLNPWIKAWEQELERKLFPKIGRTANKFVPRFDKRHLLYPDAESRSKFYASGRQWGYLTKNHILEMEGLNPDESEAGDIYTIQVNMQNDQALVDGGAADGSRQDPPTPAAGGAAPTQKKPSQGGGKKGKRDGEPDAEERTDES